MKKRIIFLFFLLLGPIFLLSNKVSAIKITDMHRHYVSSINFQTYAPNKTFSNQAIQNYVNTPVYDSVEQNMPIQGKTTFRASSLQITLETSVSAPKDYNWEQSIFVYTEVDGDHFIPTVLCPGFTSAGMQIDECEIIYHDSVNTPYQLGSQGSSNTVYDFYSMLKTYAEIKLKGHFTYNNSGNTFNLSGPFLAIYNKETSAYYGWRFNIGFSQFKYYKIVPDDDAAAEELQEMNDKDDQDRNNLETQQESNEGDAEDTKDEANTTGTTLMGAFSALITALGNVHSTNCKLPNMQVYTLQLKNMDLCTVSMPTGISALAGIAVSLLIVKLGISLVKRMLALYKEIIG